MYTPQLENSLINCLALVVVLAVSDFFSEAHLPMSFLLFVL